MDSVRLVKAKKGKIRWKKHVFCWALLIIPVAQFLIFYVGVNFNQILMSFKGYDAVNNTYYWLGFDNIVRVFKELRLDYALASSLKNSSIVFLSSTFIGITMALFFSNFIYKKAPGGKFFKVTLFLPQIISIIVMVVIFQYFTNQLIPDIVFKLSGKRIDGFLQGDGAFITILIFSIAVGFGTQVLMFSNAMSGISEAIVEAAKLDGFSYMQEFFYITLPMIYPTIVTFVVVAISNYFINQMNLFSFYGEIAPPKYSTYGYYLYSRVQSATTFTDYPFYSALGVIFTLIILPIVFSVRFLMNKFGPSVD